MADSATLIRSARFRKEREADWQRLEVLVTKAERGGAQSLGFDEARDLAALYRQATTSLAIAREISLDKALLAYLEALAARAYLSVYAPQERLGGIFTRFFTQSAPRAMRQSWFFVLMGFLCLGLGAFVGRESHQRPRRSPERRDGRATGAVGSRGTRQGPERRWTGAFGEPPAWWSVGGQVSPAAER